MLPITLKMQRLDLEISELIGFLKDARDIIQSTQNNEETLESLKPYINYTFANGPCIFLRSDKIILSNIIRRVYNEEITSEEAITQIEKAIEELRNIRKGLETMHI